jgi:hypothetical protein
MCSFIVSTMSMPISAWREMPNSSAIASVSAPSSSTRRNTSLDLHLWSAENFREVVAFVVHALSHQLIGREAAKTGTGHGGSDYRGDDWEN